MDELITKNNYGHWTAAHTRPRCEKKVADYAHAINIPCYLPLIRRCERYQRRNVITYIPMFTGYVFVCIGNYDSARLLACNRIARILQVNEEKENQLIQELNNIRIIELAKQNENIIVNPEIVPGKPVLITEGPLQGCNGIVQSRDRNARVIVNLELLGNSVIVNIDLNQIGMEVKG